MALAMTVFFIVTLRFSATFAFFFPASKVRQRGPFAKIIGEFRLLGRQHPAALYVSTSHHGSRARLTGATDWV